jgi:hypothetical protein
VNAGAVPAADKKQARRRAKEAAMKTQLAAWVALIGMACSSQMVPRVPTTRELKAQLRRGAQLVTLGSCNECHTPTKLDPDLKIPTHDMTRMLSGHPEGAADPQSPLVRGDQMVIGSTATSFKLSIGIAYSANLTPDRETGIGDWDDAMFIRAARTGRHPDAHARAILPPMPWAALGAQSDDDLRAMLAYLKSIPAVRNQVPPPRVSPQALEELANSYDVIIERRRAIPPPVHP